MGAAGGTGTARYEFNVGAGATCINDLLFDLRGIASSQTSYPDEPSVFAYPVGGVGAQQTATQGGTLEVTEAVVVGDLGSAWTFDLMNRVFRWVLGGAALLALHRNRYWKTGGELVLDVGAFVAAFEYATGREATIPHVIKRSDGPLRKVVVVGAGLQGCGVALRLAQAGRHVVVLERSIPGAEASSAAGGILSPGVEAEPGPFHELCTESLRRWPAFAAEVERLSGAWVGLRGGGTLEVGR